jgi:CelD/BcsL family acetyltransferase involved in cellulose biosynthesis
MTVTTTLDSVWPSAATDPGEAANAEAVRITVHDSIDAIALLEAEWRDLETRIDDGLGYFQSFDWCRNWCQNYLQGPAGEPGLQLQLVEFRVGRQLAGLLPLVERKQRYGLSVLETLGSPMTQYSNILFDTDLLPVSRMRECWQTFCQQTKADAIIFDRMTENSRLASILDEANLTRETGDVSLFMGLEEVENWEAFRDGFKKSVRRGRRRRFKKIEDELGRINLDVHFGGSDAYRAAVRQALEFKRIWLRESGRNTSAFSGKHACDFLSSLEGESTAQQGALCYVMSAGGKPIAIEMGFLSNRHYYCFLGSFDWSARNYSAGKVQMEQSLKWAIDNRISCIDFLGNYEAYQGDWSNGSVSMFSYSAARSIRGRLYARFWQQGLKPALKKSFRKLPPELRKRLIARLAD